MSSVRRRAFRFFLLLDPLASRLNVRMKRTVAAIFGVAVLVSWMGEASAASPKQVQASGGKQRSPSPTATPLPSVELSSFVAANLDAIVGPLEQKLPLPRTEL